MRRSSTCVDDLRDHVGGRPAQSALTGAISIAIQLFGYVSSELKSARFKACSKGIVRSPSGLASNVDLTIRSDEFLR